MLRWLAEKVEDARIARSFPAYDNARREEHLAKARRLYSTTRLEREIATLACGPARESALRFGPPAAALRADLAVDRERMKELRRRLAIFQRDYKDELDELYARSKQARDALADLYEDRDQARRNLADAQSSIDHWYRMSDCYLGNRGREIPKSRVFGRSQNDLERFKSRKAEAIARLNECREEIDDLKTVKARHGAQIDKVKAARSEMFELKASGERRGALQSELSVLMPAISEKEARLQAVKDENSRFLLEARLHLGIPEREAAVNRTKAACRDFIDAFESATALAARKAQHRREWLDQAREARAAKSSS